ncbi:hypothetical protein BC332_03880 [Capsicum chinense]|nr:hypothetical protein BC332_03880 [Capsicum chinense]
MGGDSQMLEIRSFTKVTIPIPICRNSSYDEFIASVMQSENLDCEPSDVVISYLINTKEKVNPTIINSDVRVLTYIMDADADGFRLILKINMVKRSFEGSLNSSAPPPWRSTVNNDLIDDNLNDYENGGNYSINMEDDSIHMEDFSSDSQDDEEDCETASQPGDSFSNATNFYCGQTFADKKELKILLDTVKARHKKVSSELIALVCVNYFWDGKGPSIREIQKIVFKELCCNASYWMGWKESVIAKNIIRGTPEHGYAYLPDFSHTMELLNLGYSYSIMVNRMDESFVYYFLAFGACIRGYAHMRKVIVVDGTRLYGKYGGVLLSVVA